MSKDTLPTTTSLNSDQFILEAIIQNKEVNKEINRFIDSDHSKYNKEQLIHLTLISFIAKHELKYNYDKIVTTTNRAKLVQDLSEQMRPYLNADDIMKIMFIEMMMKYAPNTINPLQGLSQKMLIKSADITTNILQSSIPNDPSMPYNGIIQLGIESVKLESTLSKFFLSIKNENPDVYLEAKRLFEKEHKKSVLSITTNGIEIIEELQLQNDQKLKDDIENTIEIKTEHSNDDIISLTYSLGDIDVNEHG